MILNLPIGQNINGTHKDNIGSISDKAQVQKRGQKWEKYKKESQFQKCVEWKCHDRSMCIYGGLMEL